MRLGLRLVVPVVLTLVLLGGCTTYSTKLRNLRPELAAGDYETALATVEQASGSKDQLLALLARGQILYYAGQYEQSNEAFAGAERLAEDLYTRSVSAGALSLISNDNALDYRARPYEMAMVQFYRGLNYIALGQRDEAVVEARRASQRLQRYTAATVSALPEVAASDLELINDNAFMQYFSGMLYDWDGDLDDAFVSYRQAALSYQRSAALLRVDIPASLAGDLERVGGRLGFGDELASLRAACPDVFAAGEPRSRRRGDGEVVVLLETGFVPRKVETGFSFPIFSGQAYDDPEYWSWQIWAGMGDMHAFASGHKVEYWATVMMPDLAAEGPGPVAGARVRAALGGEPVLTSRVANLRQQTRVTFTAEQPAIFFKTVLRGLTKYLASRGAGKAAGDWAQLLVNLAGVATETADTRSWLTLPEHVHLARLSLPPGRYDLEVDLLAGNGDLLGRRTLPGVEVRAGDWTFVVHRIFAGENTWSATPSN